MKCDICFRLVINAIALGFVSAALARYVLADQKDFIPFTFAMFVVMVFGCVLSAIDYAKLKRE